MTDLDRISKIYFVAGIAEYSQVYFLNDSSSRDEVENLTNELQFS